MSDEQQEEYFERQTNRQVLIENTGTYLYEGYAEFGVATSATGWLIIRSTLSGSDITKVDRANGDQWYNSAWDDRATESYS